MRKFKKTICFAITVTMITSMMIGWGSMTALASTPGTITNLVTKYNAATPTVARITAVSDVGLYTVQGSTGAPSTTYAGTNQQKIDAALGGGTTAAPLGHPYFTSDKTKWAYGDRNTNQVYSGADTNNAYWNMSYYCMIDSTSSILLGTNVTRILALNTEKNFTPTIPDLYSFTISKPATVYTVPMGTYDTNFVTNNGWTKENDLIVYRGLQSVLQGNDSKYYAVPNGRMNLGTIYSKHFNAGTVDIPSRGATTNNGYIIYVVWDVGTVSNPVTRFNSSTPTVARATPVPDAGLYAVQGSTGAQVTSYTGTNQQKIDATLNGGTTSAPLGDPYFTADKTRWAYGDRDPNRVFTGADTNNAFFAQSYYTMVDTTSPIFIGPKVTKLLALNTEKSFTPLISDVYSFTIDIPATVYVAPIGTYDTSFIITNGWTKETGITMNRAAVSTVLGNDSKYYAVPNGASNIGTIYSKHFTAGTVNIPSRGATASNGYVMYIVWDESNPNATLIDLKVGSTTVAGFASGTTTYNVTLPSGTTVGSPAATIAATPNVAGATASITQAAALPGSATVVVTAGNGKTKATYTVNLSIEPSVAINTDVATGSVLFEAESATLHSTSFLTASDASASGGTVLSAQVTQAVPATDTLSYAGFMINPDRATPYTVWIRYKAVSSSQNTFYYSVDGSAYTSKTLTTGSGYQWAKVCTTGNQPAAGTKFDFRFASAKAGLLIDQVIVTTYPFYTPSGALASLPDMGLGSYTLPTGTYPAPSVTPPTTHPRLMFKSSDINTIKANMAKSQNANALASYNNYLGSNVDGILPPIVLDSGTNYNATYLATIEAYALKYALDGDSTYGNKAVTAIKNYLRTIAFTDNAQDITRSMGHTIFVASEVYDWCYPLLTTSDKNYIIVAGEALAKRMETGYPPSGQGAVTGHGGEAQLLRDVLSLGIATYNERPDIYNYVAGRLLSQFVEPRNYWFASHTHNQGDSYGYYRHTWELLFQWILYRMNGTQVFSSDAQYIPTQWMYVRRPDGQQFRNGDSGQDGGSVIGNYWTSDVYATFYSSNFYNNSYVKSLYIAASPNFNTFSNSNGMLTPVTFLLLNNPDLTGISHTSSFPLTKYFGSPYGMMVARTGWTEPGTVNLSSNIAMAQMVIGEQWSANHHHLDAGSFQLYYKGALASESGIYDTYNSNHDKNYNKETIAHNSLLIKDPNEVIYGGAVNSGGQRRAGGEVSTYSQWMSSGYDTGTVLDQAYDTANTVPLYSYIKGDITRAYSSKVSEVLRSMMFMPLSDSNHPAAFIVMDKVTSSNASFAKTWLLHTQQDFTINGNTAIVRRDTDGYNGRMDLTTLLPANATLTKIGGPGNEFNINGTNYEPTKPGNNGCEKGAYRLEVSPSSANTTDYFLNVMQVSDSSANATPLTATLIENSSVAGVKLSDRVAIFGKDKDRMTDPVSFTVPGSESNGLKITVSGVAEGTWNIYKDGAMLTTATASATGGILYFEGGAGNYVVLQGTISNLVTKYNSATPTVARTTAVSNPGLFVVQGSTGAPSTSYAGTDQQRIDAALGGGTVSAPLGNPYFTSDKTKWAYGDRTTNQVYNGADAANAYWYMCYYSMIDSTSPVLLGQNVTRILALNTEKNFTPAIPDLYSFTINKPATVYVVPMGTYDTNFITNNGWTKEAGLQVVRGLESVLQGTDTRYYAVPNGGTSLGTIYSKHFAAGTVNVPSRGATASNGYVVYIVWD